MKINEIQSGMSNISIEGTIVDKAETRRVNTRYGTRSVADTILEDETGTIKLTLWEEKINQVNVKDKVRLTNAYVTEFRDELQLNIPRSGKLEVIKQRNMDEL